MERKWPMNHLLQQQLNRIEKKEQKLTRSENQSIITTTVTPVLSKIQDKIPAKLKSTLDGAFYKGFQLVFDKGTTYIEKTYQKDKLLLEHDINNYALEKRMNKKHFNKLDRNSKQSNLLNTSFSALEGGILGLLGIGIPDIPLFLSVLMKTVYEVALSYGFTYDSAEEKTYILLLLSSAVSKGEKQKGYDQQLELFGDKIDHKAVFDLSLDNQMKETASVLSEALLTIKFIQGIPFVGVVGGIANYTIVNRVGKYAALKYKKRYLKKKTE